MPTSYLEVNWMLSFALLFLLGSDFEKQIETVPSGASFPGVTCEINIRADTQESSSSLSFLHALKYTNIVNKADTGSC